MTAAERDPRQPPRERVAREGRLVKLVPNEMLVEVDEFERTDPALRREMTITITLSDADGGTDVLGVHEGLPPGISSNAGHTPRSAAGPPIGRFHNLPRQDI